MYNDDVDRMYISVRILQLAGELKRQRGEVEQAKKTYEEAKAKAEAMEDELARCMEAVGLKSFTLEGTKYTATQQVFLSPASDAKDEVIGALIAEGYGDLVHQTVNANQFRAFVIKDLLGGDIDKVITEAERICPEIADLPATTKAKAAIEMMLPPWLKGRCNIHTEQKISMRRA